MKRTLSLLEVSIGLSLTTILLMSLFSMFRFLMQTEAEEKLLRQEKQWEYVVQLRLSSIFETLQKEAYFKTEPHKNSSKNALHFTFKNPLEKDPKFSQLVDGYLLQEEKTNNLCLIYESSDGTTRKDIFLKNGKDYFLKFFDPKTKNWIDDWDQKSLPPLIKLSISRKDFFFFLPFSERTVIYS